MNELLPVITDVISVFSNVLSLFAQFPLNLIVAMIVIAFVVTSVKRLLRRR